MKSSLHKLHIWNFKFHKVVKQSSECEVELSQIHRYSWESVEF